MNEDQKSFWVLQQPDNPLFSDLIWSQPQNPTQAGKLLIIGGNVHGFSAPAQAYETSLKAGAGSIRVLLPDSLRKIVGASLDADYCPSTPSGSFAKSSLAEMLDHASWSDLSLIAGDLGRNSETAMLLESFCADFKGSLTITKDALDYFTQNPTPIVNRPDTLIVGTIAQLQKISLKFYPDNLITFNMSLLKLVEVLHEISIKSTASFITNHEGNLIIAHKGKVSSTKLKEDTDSWRVAVASFSSVWWLQNPDQTFEALTSSISLYAR